MFITVYMKSGRTGEEAERVEERRAGGTEGERRGEPEEGCEKMG